MTLTIFIFLEFCSRRNFFHKSTLVCWALTSALRCKILAMTDGDIRGAPGEIEADLLVDLAEPIDCCFIFKTSIILAWRTGFLSSNVLLRGDCVGLVEIDAAMTSAVITDF